MTAAQVIAALLLAAFLFLALYGERISDRINRGNR